ncbi:hypothetical protein CYMTET_48019 [Cymbomonas tetramitiformis]|uniref:Uncharacterized protein n=1 Tax=Cymbomonas tetramitiformis TaxID=36881 RepID=A0AAE0BT62_9CHLO|nr:hypothetical protein CYMTET_48019 [Cymbomonas tetramitiformis]
MTSLRLSSMLPFLEEERYYARYGLRAGLIAAQAANPEAPLFDEASDTILDPRRILNEDELPQFIADAKGNNKKKVGAGKGDIAQEPTNPNRTCVTVHMIWSLDGFKWGDQLIFAQARLTSDMAIDEARSTFTNEIHETQGVSTFLLISPAEKGVQTGHTLAERMDMLDKEALDQFNKKFHNQYNKAKKNYKKEKASQLTQETGKPHSTGDIKLSKVEFLIIFSRISMDWSTAEDRRTAFRVVGLLQNAMAPSEIDRKAFIVQPNSPKAQSELVFGPVASPENVRKDSAQYWKAKFYACDERRKALEQLHVRPKQIGLR